MKKWKLFIAAMLLISLTGCARQVEREPVSVKDEKAEMDPVKAQSEVSESNTAASKANAEDQERTDETEEVKEQLAEVVSLEDAPKELRIQENVGGKKTEKTLMFQKCDGGYGFYFPEHKDKELSWFRGELNEEQPEEQLIFGNLYPFYNGAGMQMTFTHYKDSTLENARSLILGNEEVMDVIGDASGGTYPVNARMAEAAAEKCTIGAGDYPALRTSKLTVPVAEQENGQNGNTQAQMIVQYYFVEVPEGLLRIGFHAPAEEMDASWSDAEQILASMIIEDNTNYKGYHSAVSVNAQDSELKFKSLSALRLFYATCLTRGDYESAMKVTKNIEPQENGKEVWEGMECSLTSVEDGQERGKRATTLCLVTLYEPGDTGIPECQDGQDVLTRYMYFIQDGGYWYLDGPLHNDEPAEEWWKGEITSWRNQNYGLSDSTEPGAANTDEQ